MDAAIGSQDQSQDIAFRYTKVAIALHWTIAALILYNLTSGLLKPVLPRPFFLFHISSGITILLLTLARIAWRLTHRPPPLLPIKTWERGLAHGVHFLLYALMLLMPLSGWALVSATPPVPPGAAAARANAPHDQAVVAPGAAPTEKMRNEPPRPHGPVMVWGLFRLPLIAPIHAMGTTPDGIRAQKVVHARIQLNHLIGGWIMLGLLLLHISGALKHQLIDRRRQLARMGLGTI